MTRSFDAAAAVRPNRAVSPAATRILVAAEAAAALGFWAASPVKVLPSPAETLRALGRLWATQGLGAELLVSFSLNLEALALATALTLALSYLTVLPAMRPVAAAVSKGRFLGMTGLTFVFTLLVGGGRPLKLALLVFGLVVFFVTSMSAVVAAVPKEAYDHARSLGMSEGRVVLEVVVLGTLDQAIEALRQNAAIGWMMLTMVEGISRSEGGVGAMLLNQNKHFHLAEVFAIQLLVLAIGLAQDGAIGLLRRKACPWADLGRERKE